MKPTVVHTDFHVEEEHELITIKKIKIYYYKTPI